MSEFNPETLDADDPGLTAFALGELEGADAEHYADRVRQSPELQALVQQIQSEGQLLSAELRLEPIEPLTSDRRATIVAHAAVALPTQSTVTRESRRSLWIRWLAMTAGSAAVITGIAIALPKAQTSKVALDEMAKHETLTKRGTVTGMGASPKYESKAEVVDLASPATVRSSPQPRQREHIHGIERNMVLEADGAALKVTDELSDVDFDATSVPTTSASSAKRGSAPADEKGQKEDRGGVARNQWKTVKMMAADSSEIRFGEKRGESNSLGLQPAEPHSSVSTVQDPSSETKPVSGPQTGTLLGKGKEGNSGRWSKSGKPEPTGFTENGDNAKGEVRGRISDKESKGFEGSKLAAIADSVQGEARKSESYARRYENLAERKLEESIAPTQSNGPAKPDASTPKAAGFSALTDLYDGEHKSADLRKKLSLEKSEKENVEKNEEFALVELSRARESERLHPGSIPVEELQRLERASETEARQRRLQADPTGAEAYQPIFENSFVSPAKEPQSTFSIDVDSASYSNMRRFLMSGQVPPADAIRIEELINYFSYQYPVPQDGKPFSVNTDIAACPWNPGHHLVRIGLKGKEIAKDQRPPSSLVFLVDVSGSMTAENKLPLVKSSLKTLVGQLDERDRIAIVTYAGEAGLRLSATSVAQRDTILAAIDGLGAGGSTNGAAGINTAYDIAAKEFVEKGTNRVILCTDGDFNVGVTTNAALEDMITTRAKGGVFLSVFGFGMGNLKDDKLEQLADKGNGQYGYIDDRQEADKVFVQELSGTLVTIAKDVKIQIDFDTEAVASYRLVGYENRVLATEDFNNDKKDAGEIGAGHTVTALYEIVPVKDLKPNDKTRWMNVKLRYKQPESSTSELIENPLVGQPGQLKLASSDFQFAAAVASFGMLLRNSQHAGQANWGMVKELAQSGLSNDQYGHRSGFRRLVDQAESLVGERRPVAPPEPESTVNGKYKSLLRRLNVPEDAKQYGQFKDYGFDQTKTYGGSDNLPEGYWVYVAPYWYIWGETSQK
jgi:secreted protein with Ig-like and vWFA domain